MSWRRVSRCRRGRQRSKPPSTSRRKLRPGPRGEPPCGGLVAFIQFRFGGDGYRLLPESLETAAAGPAIPGTFVADAFKPPPQQTPTVIPNFSAVFGIAIF